MKKNQIERAIDALEAKKAAIDAAIAELRAQQSAKPARRTKPRAVPPVAQGA